MCRNDGVNTNSNSNNNKNGNNMEWSYYAPDALSASGPLGYYVGDKFKPCQGAKKALDEMNRKLLEEDKTLRTFRR